MRKFARTPARGRTRRARFPMPATQGLRYRHVGLGRGSERSAGPSCDQRQRARRRRPRMERRPACGSHPGSSRLSGRACPRTAGAAAVPGATRTAPAPGARSAWRPRQCAAPFQRATAHPPNWGFWRFGPGGGERPRIASRRCWRHARHGSSAYGDGSDRGGFSAPAAASGPTSTPDSRATATPPRVPAGARGGGLGHAGRGGTG